VCFNVIKKNQHIPPPLLDNLNDNKPIADCGATHTFIASHDTDKLQHVQKNNTDPITVSLPNGAHIKSLTTGYLPTAPHLPPIPGYVFPADALNRSLLSMADYTNMGCTVTLTKTKISITHGDTELLAGTKAPTDKLWTIDLPTQQTTSAMSANTVIHHQNNADAVAFWSAALGNPSDSTLVRALSKGYLTNIPRITASMVAANRPNSMATAKGHLDLTRQGIRSTKASPSANATEISEENNCPAPHVFNPALMLHTIDLNMDTTIHSDATGKFPVQSKAGNNYILLSMYNGYTHMEPLQNRGASQYVKAFQATLEFFKDRSHPVTAQRLDNETSGLLEKFLTKNQITIEYVPLNAVIDNNNLTHANHNG
jgi:hypothetical protein